MHASTSYGVPTAPCRSLPCMVWPRPAGIKAKACPASNDRASRKAASLQAAEAAKANTVRDLSTQRWAHRCSCNSSRVPHAPTSSEGGTTTGVAYRTWAAPCGTKLEVLHQPPTSISRLPGQQGRPPVVLIHGLFRAAWCWEEHVLPTLAAAGYDCYALSLRGQGGSELGESVAQVAAQQGGVPLDVNVGDIAAFVASLPAPPVLVGHSLGGMFVQEYLARLEQQQQQQEVSATPTPTTTSSSSSDDILQQPVPPLSGAVLLASACCGTVMAFGDFIRDVGLPEFLYQMYIVFSHAHLRDINVARYCWWEEQLAAEDAERYLRTMQSSSKVCPYISAEVSRWHPAPPENPNPLPATLALGGAEDKVIRPFQVSAAAERWGAKVVVLEGVTHDVMLGPQGTVVAAQLLGWLDTLPVADASFMSATPTLAEDAHPSVSSSAVAVSSRQQGEVVFGADVGSSSSSGSSNSRSRRGEERTGGGSTSKSRMDVDMLSPNGPNPPAAFS